MSNNIEKNFSEVGDALEKLNKGKSTEREFLFEVDNCKEQISKLFTEIEEYKNDCDKYVNEKIQKAKSFRISLNELINKNDEINKIPPTERVYYLSMINLGLIPVFSSLGIFALFFYMREIGMGRLFYDVATDAQSLIFFFVIGITIFLLFFSLPVVFTYLEIDKIKNQDKRVGVSNNFDRSTRAG